MNRVVNLSEPTACLFSPRESIDLPTSRSKRYLREPLTQLHRLGIEESQKNLLVKLRFLQREEEVLENEKIDEENIRSVLLQSNSYLKYLINEIRSSRNQDPEIKGYRINFAFLKKAFVGELEEILLHKLRFNHAYLEYSKSLELGNEEEAKHFNIKMLTALNILKIDLEDLTLGKQEIYQTLRTMFLNNVLYLEKLLPRNDFADPSELKEKHWEILYRLFLALVTNPIEKNLKELIQYSRRYADEKVSQLLKLIKAVFNAIDKASTLVESSEEKQLEHSQVKGIKTALSKYLDSRKILDLPLFFKQALQFGFDQDLKFCYVNTKETYY